MADERALSAGQTVFPEFNPVIGEEELTIKQYPFPGSKLVITASVFYTDESMASHPHGEFVSHSESMLIGITVGSKAKRNAISTGADGSVAEVTYDQFTNIVRAAKYITVRGRSYLVGIECDCMAEKRPKTVKTVNGRNPNEYNLVVVENPNRKNSSSQNVPKDLNVVVGDNVIARIQLPNGDSEAKNFSLNSVTKTSSGFVMATDWGGSLYHYEVKFDFRYKGNNFYLYQVTKTSFLTTNPDSGNFWDKKKMKVTRLKPNLPIERFVLTKYL